MRFLVDAQLPPRLARELSSAGHTAEHVEDAGLRDASDSEIWNYAVTHQAVIVTKDEDFVDRYRRQTSSPVIVWLRIGNASNRALLIWFIPLLPSIVQRIEAGDKLIEVR